MPTQTTLRRIQAVVAIVSVLSLTGGLSFGGLTLAQTPPPGGTTAPTDATIVGKVLKPDGKPITFACQAQPGSPTPPPPGSLCSPGVGAFSGHDTPPYFTGASTADGSFTLPVRGGMKYQLEIHGPPEAIGQFTFPPLSVEIATGETKNVGTISPTVKGGHIKGQVVLSGTSTPVPGVFLSAFPMMPPGGEGDHPGPVFPSQATSGTDGSFDILVNAGRYIVNVENRPESQYVSVGGPPTEANVETDTSTVTGITVSVTKADAIITGRVLNEAGVQVHFPGGVGARPVGATDFSDFNGPIMPPGTYTIKVSSAKATQYTLNVHLPPGSEYSVKGTITVTVVPNGTVTQDITLAKNTSAIFGQVISDSGFALSACKSSGDDRFGGKRFGEVFAHSPQSGNFNHAEIKEDCTFRISLGAGVYQFGYHLNPTAGFINRPAPPEQITVEAGQQVEKNITVLYGDSTINVSVFDPEGKPMTFVHVEASNDREVHEQFKQGGSGPGGGAPPAPGGPGGPGDNFRGPGGTTSPEEMMKYCLQDKNKTECQNFKLPPGATGPGACTNMLECSQYCSKNPTICAAFDKEGHDQPPAAQGKKILGASFKGVIAAGQVKVNAEDVTKGELQGPDLARDVIRSGTETGPDGTATLNVLGGKQYAIRAFLPPDRNTGNLLPPKAAIADLRTAKTATVVIQFRTSFGAMTGKVLLPTGTATRFCFVHFWSEDGADGGSPCNPDGTGSFTLGYGQGVLHFSADSFDPAAKKLYRSDEEIVAVSTQKTLTKNFTLKESDEKLFTPVTKTCDSDEACTVSLDNGGSLTIPAAAAGANKTLTVTAQPTVDLKATETVDPGLGYSFEVKDSNGQEVTEFETNVTMEIPYEAPEGLDERFLSSKFVNESTGAYEDPTSSTQDTGEDTFTVSDNHLSDWTVVSPGGEDLKSVTTETSGKNTKVTIGGAKTITLKGGKASTWNVGTADFGSKLGQQIVVSSNKKGGKLYRYDTNGKIQKTQTPISGYKGGLNQLLTDITAKSGSIPDGTDEVVVAPAKDGPPQAVVFNLKDNKTLTVTTGEGTGATTLSAPELVTKGVANLATVFGKKTTKAFALSKGGKLAESKSKSVTSLLSVKNGVVEKKTQTPKVKSKSGTCSTSATSKITLKGSGFNGPMIALWKAETAISATAAANGKSMTITINPSVTDVEDVNTLTIVNADGQAGVTKIQCK